METAASAKKGFVASAFFALFFAWSFSQFDVNWSLYFLGIFFSAALGVLIYVKIALQICPRIKERVPCHPLILEALQSKEETKYEEESKEDSIVFSRNVDNQINIIVQNVIEDYVLCWLKPLIGENDTVEIKLKRDIWSALRKLNDRLTQVDKVQLLASDLVQKLTEHFSRIREAKERHQNDEIIDYTVPDYLLRGENREIDLLAKIADVVILFLLPPGYSTCIGTRSTLREIFSRRLLYPIIDRISDPRCINGNIIAWLSNLSNPDSTVDGTEIKLEIFTAANSYADFLSSLKQCNDASSLRQQRFNILTEIVQATTLNNLSSAREKENDKLKTYIGQLVRAKTVCEDRLLELGFDPYKESLPDLDQGRCKNLSFAAIMNSSFSRRFFYHYLEQQNMQDLLGFWAAVEELKEAEKTLWHQLCTEIFYTYINNPSTVIKVSRPSLKKIEAFLIGDSSPDIFYQIQKEVMQTLETSYYPAFLISDLCYKMLDEAHEKNFAINEPELNIEDNSCRSPKPAESNETDFAKSYLDQINEKLQNKVQAMKALKGSLKSESKVLKMLEGQVSALEDSKQQVEQHLERTEAWTEHLGDWRCHVQNVEFHEDDLKVTLIVHVPMNSAKKQRPPSWVCRRNVQDFHSLNRELMPYFSWLKSMSLPSGSSNNFTRNSNGGDEKKTEKARTVLQKYIDAVLCDDRLNQSEVIYSFLNPSPTCLNKSTLTEPKFHLPNLFKKAHVDGGETRKRQLRWLDSKSRVEVSEEMLGEDTRDLGALTDGVAEPLYGLISEVFDLRGVSKILRKSMMTFVQITFGSTINRQIKDTVAWLTSDLVATKCLKILRTSAWPNSDGSQNNDAISEDPGAVRQKAKLALLERTPDWLTQLVGLQASKVGISKVFDTLQDKTLNKLLVYELLEIVIYNLFPELVRSYAFQQFRNMSV